MTSLNVIDRVEDLMKDTSNLYIAVVVVAGLSYLVYLFASGSPRADEQVPVIIGMMGVAIAAIQKGKITDKKIESTERKVEESTAVSISNSERIDSVHDAVNGQREKMMREIIDLHRRLSEYEASKNK